MTEIKIEKGVPIPKSNSKWQDILLKMKAGDSFVVPNINTAGSVRACSRRLGVKITMHGLTKGQVRIWKK